MTTQTAPQPARKLTVQERKRRATRDAILDALAETVREQGITSFSVQDVATRAGLSHRTVYRFFESREALIEAAHAWVAEAVAEEGIKYPETLDDLGPHIETLFRVLDRHADLVRAGAMLDAARPRPRPGYEERTALIRRLFEEEFPNVPQAEREGISAVVRALFSAQMWLQLDTQQGLSGQQSGPAVRAAIETLIADMRRKEQQARAAGRRA